MAFASGGLFGNGEPAKKEDKPKTVEELQRELAVLTERNAQLTEQNKIQRDSFLQLSQHSNQQVGILQNQLNRQVLQHNPNAIPQAQGTPASGNWGDILDSVTGGQPASQPGVPLDRNAIRQEIRAAIREEEQQANNSIHQENQELAQLVHTFKIANPDLASNKQFSAEVDRIFASLRRRGMSVAAAWESSLQEAAHITVNYSRRRDPEKPKDSQQRQMVPGHAYLFPMAQAGPGGAGKEDNLAIDMRRDEDRFKDAKEELTATQLAAAQRMFGNITG